MGRRDRSATITTKRLHGANKKRTQNGLYGRQLPVVNSMGTAAVQLLLAVTVTATAAATAKSERVTRNETMKFIVQL